MLDRQKASEEADSVTSILSNFQELTAKENELKAKIVNEKDTLAPEALFEIVAAMFEYSLEDGLHLAEMLELSYEEVIASIFSPKMMLLNPFILGDIVEIMPGGHIPNIIKTFLDGIANSSVGQTRHTSIVERIEKFKKYMDEDWKQYHLSLGIIEGSKAFFASTQSNLLTEVGHLKSHQLKTRKLKAVRERAYTPTGNELNAEIFLEEYFSECGKRERKDPVGEIVYQWRHTLIENQLREEIEDYISKKGLATKLEYESDEKKYFLNPTIKGSEVERKLALLNTVHKPTAEVVQVYRENHGLTYHLLMGSTDEERKELLDRYAVEANQQTADFLSMILEENPTLFTTLNIGKISKKRRTWQEKEKKREKFVKRIKALKNPGTTGHVYLASQRLKDATTHKPETPPLPERFYLGVEDPTKLEGEDDPHDEREILTIDKPLRGFLVKEIYGHYSQATDLWSKVHFSASSGLYGQPEKTKITLLNTEELDEVIMAKALPAIIDSDQVKGIETKKEENLRSRENTLGEAVALNQGAPNITYEYFSGEKEIIARNITQEEYDEYKEKFKTPLGNIEDVGEDERNFIESTAHGLDEVFGDLPIDLELFLESISSLLPQHKVKAIHKFVKNICYYDHDNKEIAALKENVPFEERLKIMRSRMDQLRQEQRVKEHMFSKQYAGVCRDFAPLTVALLRKVGLLSGVATGFQVNGTKAKVKNYHVAAYVVWPGNKGENRIIIIDTTPSEDYEELPFTWDETGSTERKNLSETWKLKEIRNLTRAGIARTDELGDNLPAKDVAMARKMRIAETEDLTPKDIQVFRTFLEIFWYGGGRKLNINNYKDRLEMITFYRKDFPFIIDLSDGETNIHLLIEDYLSKFIKEGKAADSTEAVKFMRELIKIGFSSNVIYQKKFLKIIDGYKP